MKRVVLAGTVVGWHGGGIHFYQYFGNAGNTRLASKAKKLYESELKLFKKMEVDYSLIIDSGDAVRVKSPRLVKRFRKNGIAIETLEMEAEFDLWVPPPSTIAKYGIEVDFDRFWYTSNVREIEEILKGQGSDYTKITIESMM